MYILCSKTTITFDNIDITASLTLLPVRVQIDKVSHSLIHRPVSVVCESIKKTFDRPKPSFAIIERDVDAIVSESNNIRTTVSCQVYDIPRVLADLPPLLHTEILDYELGWSESPISIVVRDVNSRFSESNDVSSFVTGEVGDITRMLVDLPSLSSSELVGDEVDGTKSAISSI